MCEGGDFNCSGAACSSCEDDEIQCDEDTTPMCVSKHFMCDFIKDCADGKDEEDCREFGLWSHELAHKLTPQSFN